MVHQRNTNENAQAEMSSFLILKFNAAVFIVFTREGWGNLGSRRFLPELDLQYDAVEEIGSIGKVLNQEAKNFFVQTTRILVTFATLASSLYFGSNFDYFRIWDVSRMPCWVQVAL
ncbi:hypothetical protein M0R45_019051 [Rubus argutus]|uniref:Uncharacterized protein n=1 Tax=Rubus argutus TaxID=59490 RepID=A0AAW1X7U4_RUBAR